MRLPELGAFIARTREALGWSKAELGRRAGWADHSNVSRIEDGRDLPASSLVRVTEALGLEVRLVRAASTEALAARLGDVDASTAAVVAEILDVLADAPAGVRGRVLQNFAADAREWRAKIARDRAAGLA